MGIYIFNWEKLRAYLIADENDPSSSKDFGKNIIPNMLAAGEKLWPYRFEGVLARRRHDNEVCGMQIWTCFSTNRINLYDPSWPISSRSPICPPHYTGKDASIVHSIVTEGCDIDGHVENSVLSSSVRVEKGARAVQRADARRSR